MKMKIEIDINSDAADFLIVENLKQTIADMENDLERNKEGVGTAIFSTNKEEDLVEIAKHIDAFRTTLSYFGVSNENI
jgi:hypothetical protein